MARVIVAATIAVLLFLSVANGAKPRWRDLTADYSYDQYLRDFGHRIKKGTREYSMREKIFKTELARVLAHNAKKGITHHEGINDFSDWTVEEKARRNGALIPDMHPQIKSKSKPLYTHTYNGEPLPEEVDWRKAVMPSVLTAIKNQGMCGDCYAHSATESMESHYAIKTGQLHVMSQQQVTSCMQDPLGCGGNGGCGGGFAELCFDYVQEAGGIHQEWVYPFTSYNGDGGQCLNKTGQYEQPVAKVKGYVGVDKNNASATMHALATKGPLSIYVDASSWSSYEGGVWTQEQSGCVYADNITMDHVVQLVGYGHDYDLGLNYWIVRNSWGAGWGEDGFIRLHRPSEEGCGWNTPNAMHCAGGPSKVWACGLCGLLMDPLYPVMSDYIAPPP